MVVFPGSPPVPPVPLYPPGSPFSGFCNLRDSGFWAPPFSPLFGTPFLGFWGFPYLPRDPPFLVFLGFSPFLVLALLGFPNSVESLCRARGGSVHRVPNYLKNSQKRGVLGGGQKVSKKGQKRGKIENDFFKVWKKRSKQPLPPHLT